jgi:RNA methyltransferase, TrmH family
MEKIITSKNNQAVKFARQLEVRKARKRENLFTMEGIRALSEVVKHHYPVHSLYYSIEIAGEKHAHLLEQLVELSDKVYALSNEVLASLSPVQTSQGIVAVLPQKSWDTEEVLNTGRYFVSLYQVRDPGNMGTIIRSASAFACGGIILVGDCVDPYNSKVVRSTAGYILTTPIIHFPSPGDLFRKLESSGVETYALTPHTENSLGKLDINRKLNFILGSESAGFSDDIRNFPISVFRIPMENMVESLNLSVCASIVMHNIYELQQK